jgi:hypothetical protein
MDVDDCHRKRDGCRKRDGWMKPPLEREEESVVSKQARTYTSGQDRGQRFGGESGLGFSRNSAVCKTMLQNKVVQTRQ